MHLGARQMEATEGVARPGSSAARPCAYSRRTDAGHAAQVSVHKGLGLFSLVSLQSVGPLVQHPRQVLALLLRHLAPRWNTRAGGGRRQGRCARWRAQKERKRPVLPSHCRHRKQLRPVGCGQGRTWASGGSGQARLAQQSPRAYTLGSGCRRGDGRGGILTRARRGTELAPGAPR